jgi:mannose-1-phosphate guanylyltransferase
VIDEVYPKITSISIDYGIMEKADNVYVVPGEFGWNDVGSFDMLGVLHDADENGNIKIGDQINVDTKNCITYSAVILSSDKRHIPKFLASSTFNAARKLLSSLEGK